MSKKVNKETVQQILDEIQNNRNHTWYQELYNRNSQNLTDIALIYRGNEITYAVMFRKMQQYANSLVSYGIHEGDEIPICLTNMPELVYILGAISLVGAKANVFGADFEKEYITEIINDCSSKLIFILDNSYAEIEAAIKTSKTQNIVMCSLIDSLPNGTNPYNEYDCNHVAFSETRSIHMCNNSKIISMEQFVSHGKTCNALIINKCDLDSEFVITYTSGSTNTNRPKAIVHKTRSFITMGRWHDYDIKKTSMKKYRYQAHIPCHSNTDIITCISDALMQGAQLALEPIYDKDFFTYSLLINRPNYVVATRSFWIHIAKYLSKNPNIKLPFLFLPFSVGEPVERNEEAFINKWLRKADAGKDIVSAPFSVVTLSVAGGDCEHGGIFYVLFRATQNLRISNIFKNQEAGMVPFGMVDVAVIDTNKNMCKPYQIGRLVANSPCTMKGYKNNPTATSEFFIKDSTGKVWGDCRVYGYIDKRGSVHMKGRMPDIPNEIPLYQIAETILSSKKILSCEVVKFEENYISHIEFKPHSTVDCRKLLKKLQYRCEKKFGQKVTDHMYWRIRTSEESFPLTGCGKRSAKALCSEGISSQCISFSKSTN